MADEYVGYHDSYCRKFEARRHLLRQNLPPNEPVLGYYADSYGVDETALWLPFNGGRVERILPGDPPDQLTAWHLDYVVTSGQALWETRQTPNDWAQKYHATLVKEFLLTTPSEMAHGYYDFYLFRLDSPTTTNEPGYLR